MWFVIIVVAVILVILFIKSENRRIPFYLNKYENKAPGDILDEANFYVDRGRIQYATHHVAGYAFYLIGHEQEEMAERIIDEYISDLQRFEEMTVFVDSLMPKYDKINDPIHNRNFKILLELIMVNLNKKMGYGNY